MKIKKIIMVLFAVVIISIPLISSLGVFDVKGTDDMAESKIKQINSEYKPWLKGVNGPSSAVSEGLLFSLQAAIGVGFILYFVGRKKNV